ncbi:MAG: hypothetical protein JWR80_6183 [Bradyrhizobium sp.]|nr:hypothetical protein [Bradyrhizobium sp.]
MKKTNQGENLTREWSEDPWAREIWHALQLIKADPPSGLAALEELAEAGSPLSMMHLGYIYLAGQFGVGKDLRLAEIWLRRSSNAGSVEGKFFLAKLLHIDGRPTEALSLYDQLASIGFAPATYNLGLQYYLGEVVKKDINKSLLYFEQADAAGHLHSRHWASHILMKDKQALSSWMRGLLKRLKLFIPMITTMRSYPASDRLRR